MAKAKSVVGSKAKLMGNDGVLPKKVDGKDKSEGFDKSVGGTKVEVPSSGQPDFDSNPKLKMKELSGQKRVGSAGGNQPGNAYSTVRKAQKGESDY